MILTSLKLRGFSSAFPGVVELPLRDIPPGLVALVGRNGSGKTTILDAVPGAIYRRLPARGGISPVDYAIARDSFIDLEYQIGDVLMRSRVNMDAQTRKTDAVLESCPADVHHFAPLNNGQASTYDKVIADRFPSFDLFINSSFAAQGRGDEFARATPSKRKDLFAEFLALKRLLAMAKSAGEAVALCQDARLRLSVAIETLERDTAAGMLGALDAWANELQAKGGQAELRKRQCDDQVAALEAREALSADVGAALAAAQLRVQTFSQEVRGRRDEAAAAARARAAWTQEAQRDHLAIEFARDAALKDVETRIAGNQQIQGQKAAIEAAVETVKTADAAIGVARAEVDRAQAARVVAGREMAILEQAVHAFTAPQRELALAQRDSAILGSVPCGGEGTFGACQFLVNAKVAAGRIEALETQLAGLTEAVTRRDALAADVRGLDDQIARHRASLAAGEADKRRAEATAKYADALRESTARLADLETRRADLLEDFKRQLCAADQRRVARLAEFDAADMVVADALARLTVDLEAAQHDLDAAAAGNRQAVEFQQALGTARRERDEAVRLLGEIASGHTELHRRRADIQAKRVALADRRARQTKVDAELLEWQYLAKALGKGGLPDLEMDAAGPTLSATTNALLLASYGPRFSLELVTQTEKADGSGLKDEFTVRVLDNEEHGGWRDLSELSGGQKVVVQEAFMCAIALYINERSPFPIRTLFRDETGAALDAENAVAYVEMLRKVRELGAFHHVLFVSHIPAVQALADTQIRVGGGTATIVDAPFAEVA